MESFETSFTAAKQKKKKQKRTRNIILICAGVLLAAVGTFVVINIAKTDGGGTSTLSSSGTRPASTRSAARSPRWRARA